MNKKFIGVLLFFFVTAVAFSAEADDVLGEAGRLMEAGRYYTAFKLLNDNSWGTENPDIVLKKVKSPWYMSAPLLMRPLVLKIWRQGEDFGSPGTRGTYATTTFPSVRFCIVYSKVSGRLENP